MRAVLGQWRKTGNKNGRDARRVTLVVASTLVALAFAAPAAQADFGVAPGNFQAGVLVKDTTQFPGGASCDIGDAITSPPTQRSMSLYATQAGSHPFCGFTSFAVNTTNGTPDGTLKDVRVDLPAGLVPDPQAVPDCPAAAGAAVTSCPASTQVGQITLTADVLGSPMTFSNVPVYNVAPPAGAPADFAFTVTLPLIPIPVVTRVDIVGGVRDAPQGGSADDLGQTMPGDYGEYFTISNLPSSTPTISSTLTFFGDPGAVFNGASGTPFLTNPSTCAGPQTSYLSVDSYESPGQFQTVPFTTPVGANGCNALSLKTGALAPTLSITPTNASNAPQASVAHDTPTGVGINLKVPPDNNAADLAAPEIQNVQAVLPPGFTINPAAAPALQTCSDAQFDQGGDTPIACPAGAVIGSATITSPVLASPLSGDVYLGSPVDGDPYRLFVAANSPDVTDAAGQPLTVRLEGSITPDPNSGQLTTTFTNNPQVPFSDLSLTLNGGPNAVIASPVDCGTEQGSATLTPWSGATGPTPTATAGVTVDADGQGGACPSPTAFAPTTAVADTPTTAGAKSALTLTVARGAGQQYLSQINAALPEGLLGMLASVPLCPAAQASAGTCSTASLIGTTTVGAGAGATPLSLSGEVYLTGPYGGSPFGLSIVVPAAAGPYNLGIVVVRAGIAVTPTNARILIGATLPQIVGGIPLRIRSVAITINRSGFLFNPTGCAANPFGGSLVGAEGATVALSVPFAATGCSGLAFTPTITASTNGKTSATNGASLNVTVRQPAGGTNLHSVGVTLPKQLSARLSTVQEACLNATFSANPASCPKDSVVGTSTASTPVLPAPLTGTVYLVTSTSAGLPTLDVVLSGSGVTVDLIGTIALTAAGTTSTFASIPDVPISTFTLSLTESPHSALSATGNLCPGPLSMATQLTGQNGATKNPTIAVTVTGCTKPKVIALLSHRYVNGALRLKVRVLAAGRISASGPMLRKTLHTAKKAGTFTFSVKLSRAGLTALRRHHQVKVALRLGFVPKRKAPSTITNVKWTLKTG